MSGSEFLTFTHDWRPVLLERSPGESLVSLSDRIGELAAGVDSSLNRISQADEALAPLIEALSGQNSLSHSGSSHSLRR